jgi:phosphohistidine phosphatase
MSQDNIMIVGHLPFMERLTSFLITGDVERPVFTFQNGGIVCLDEDPEAKGWVIKWTLMPEIG